MTIKRVAIYVGLQDTHTFNKGVPLNMVLFYLEKLQPSREATQTIKDLGQFTSPSFSNTISRVPTIRTNLHTFSLRHKS